MSESIASGWSPEGGQLEYRTKFFVVFMDNVTFPEILVDDSSKNCGV